MPAQWGRESRDSPGMAPLPPQSLFSCSSFTGEGDRLSLPIYCYAHVFSLTLLLWPLPQGTEGKGTQAGAGARSEGSRRMSMEDLQGTPASAITHWAFSTLSFIVWEVFSLA